MEPERWALIERLCEQAAILPGPERQRMLAEHCGGDADLVAEILELISQVEQAPEFLERPLGARISGNELLAALEVAFGTIAEYQSLPEHIGGYRIVRRLDRGGMGEVFLATNPAAADAPPVAIKVIRAGRDSGSLLRRFELEQRILANLEHPNIARLIDAVTTDDGRPAFVLEYVDGSQITEHCDLNQLGITERLGLALDVCSAVAHAHRNLVVHRDIKPGNILVTAAGEVRLLDFGIGKVMSADPATTGTADRVLTLEYAAPEQLLGGVITTATDIHGIGILLYELLTGIHPFRVAATTPGVVENAILDSDPARPSEAVLAGGSSGPVAAADCAVRANRRGAGSPEALSRKLRGDLDNIVLMALRKEPERRYPAVTALADDIRRHLAGLPIRARPDTLGYRARKFIRRNAGSVAVASLTAVALVATTTVALVQSHRASQAVVATARERDQARAVRSFLLEMFGSTGASDTVGANETVRAMLDRQAGRIDMEFSDRPLLRARMLEALAEGYQRLGLYPNAIPLSRQALEVRTANDQSSPADIAASENLLGWVLHQSGDRIGAREHLEHAVTLWRAQDQAGNDADGLARALNDLGVWANSAGEYARAESLLNEALALRRVDGDSLTMGVGITANNLAAAHYYQGRYQEAARIQQLSLAALDRKLGPDHQRSVIARGNLAAFMMAAGEFVQAVDTYRDLLDRQTGLQGRSHPVTVRTMTALASALTGIAATDTGRRDAALSEAELLLREALQIQQQRTGAGDRQRGVTLDRLSGVMYDRGELQTALTIGRRALRILARTEGPDHPTVGATRARLALIEAGVGNHDQAVALGATAVTTLQEQLGADHPETARGLGRYCRALLLVEPEADRSKSVCDRALTRLRAAPAGYRGDLRGVELAIASRP